MSHLVTRLLACQGDGEAIFHGQGVGGPMGREVPAITVSQQDRRRYREKVRRCLDVLARMLRESRFETASQRVGLEIEFNLVDEAGTPSMKSAAALKAIDDPDWAAELGQFNLEINVPPRPLSGDTLAQLETHVRDSLQRADRRARDVGCRLAMIGILPTLREGDVGANSPFLFGRELWRETRITLFQQATDTRPEELQAQGVRPRVWFGERWITSVFDLFEENIRYFPALLPLCEDEDPVTQLEQGRTPELAELTLHNGTVYRW